MSNSDQTDTVQHVLVFLLLPVPNPHPRPADPLWFAVDKTLDDEAELAKEEAQHAAVGGDVGEAPAGISDVGTLACMHMHMQKIASQGSDTDLTPIGKTRSDQFEEDEEDEAEDSESDHDDEDEEDVDMVNNFNQEDHNNPN